MSILFTLFIVVGILAGWMNTLLSRTSNDQLMVWSCILVSLVFGFLAEVLVARWRFETLGSRGRRWLLRNVATNWLAPVEGSTNPHFPVEAFDETQPTPSGLD
jgi:uncharacterized membrane protein YeaQ/YmgE (transglycosylase-associated protein family)